ncbi:nucleotidyltransferase [Sphaerisporangium melleum]|uniref:Nucleotidyltransferase n=1 Tax=Sphaerisporangium melleum TaxID=321316 RepID=A0A917RC76_9ACTN|nr:nucleotidyltransferase family protein [Sphaerisporangium melleum]GGK99927.1 nucleotidyltransferase [Sphaerisporangium melleum]GII71280.1 nucleotidyltransferase [Sphaerisporangium melleum]
MTMEELDRLRPAIAELCAGYGVVELMVFGSTARGEARRDSDVDLLYVRGFHAIRGLAFFGLHTELEALLGHSVDLVSKDALHWAIRDEVLGEAEVLYAA